MQSQDDSVERRWVGETAMAECKECGLKVSWGDYPKDTRSLPPEPFKLQVSMTYVAGAFIFVYD